MTVRIGGKQIIQDVTY